MNRLSVLWLACALLPERTNAEPYVSTPVYLCGIVAFIWYIVVLALAYTGVYAIFRRFNGLLCILPPASSEGVTIIRPLKGLDPEVETCLRSLLTQHYPKYEVLFCVESSLDPVVPVVRRLLQEHSNIDARLLVGAEHFGPNPKINNMAKGFVEAKYDIIWVMDLNVWALGGVLARSVNALQNLLDNNQPTYSRTSQRGRVVRIVHHLPLAVALKNDRDGLFQNLGCKLDEMFLKTSHAKFYVGFDQVSVAPCVNGKLNMYRRSDIDSAVRHIGEGYAPSDGKSGNLGRDAAYYGSKPGFGIRYFSRFIGEDNMIGIAVWDIGGRTGLTGDAVLQPLGDHMNDGVKDYILRRLRWLRVRKYMVLAATLLEPTTESIVASIYGTFGVSAVFFGTLWSWGWFVFHFFWWFLTDLFQFLLLSRSGISEDPRVRETSPFFVGAKNSVFTDGRELNLGTFVVFWALREILALPIWAYAMIGENIDWRGRPFRINLDLTAEEI